MKKLCVGAIVVSFLMAVPVCVYAADKKSQAQINAQMAAEGQVRALRNQQALTAACETLMSREWLVTFIPDQGQAKASMKTDVFSIGDGKLSIKGLLSRGYQQSNYAMSVLKDGTVVLETMQKSKAEGGVLFWRGELRGEVLTGFMTITTTKGGKEDYSFTSAKR